MLTCKDIARKAMAEERYTLKEKIEYRIHLWMCAACRVYAEQMKNFDSTVKKILKKKAEAHRDEADSLKNEILSEAKAKFPSRQD